MKRILASLAAAGLLVAGVATAAVVSGSSASAQETTDDADTTTTVERPEKGAVVSDVLDGLVADNVIDQTQADAIMSALQDKWAELEANRPEGRHGPGFHRGFRDGFHLGALFEDGVIDAEELASLPEGNPLTDPDGPFAEVASDQTITLEEFRSVVEQLRAEGQGRFGHFGPRFGEEAPSVEGTSL